MLSTGAWRRRRPASASRQFQIDRVMPPRPFRYRLTTLRSSLSRSSPPGSRAAGRSPFWMHHCLPGTYPAPGKALKLSCKLTRGPDGAFQCYITQVRRDPLCCVAVFCGTRTRLQRIGREVLRPIIHESGHEIKS